MKIEIPYGMTKQMMEIGEEAEVLTASVFQNINNKNPEELDIANIHHTFP